MVTVRHMLALVASVGFVSSLVGCGAAPDGGETTGTTDQAICNNNCQSGGSGSGSSSGGISGYFIAPIGFPRIGYCENGPGTCSFAAVKNYFSLSECTPAYAFYDDALPLYTTAGAPNLELVGTPNLEGVGSYDYLVEYCALDDSLTTLVADEANSPDFGFPTLSTTQRTLQSAAPGHAYLRYSPPTSYTSSPGGGGTCNAGCTMKVY
jgi:hypothetical protein